MQFTLEQPKVPLLLIVSKKLFTIWLLNIQVTYF